MLEIGWHQGPNSGKMGTALGVEGCLLAVDCGTAKVVSLFVVVFRPVDDFLDGVLGKSF